MLIQAALNGSQSKADHPAVPLSIEELTREATACVAAGAGAIHLHPRDAAGHETLEPAIVDEVTTRVQQACGVPVGVTTGAWIEPDLARRLAQVRAWRSPTTPRSTSPNRAQPRSCGHCWTPASGSRPASRPSRTPSS